MEEKLAENVEIITNSNTLLALGDSYTIGEGVSEDERFPNQTLLQLKLAGITVKQPATIIATTGWTTRNLLDGIEQANLSKTFDIVSLLIGVNNQYQHLPIHIYKNEFEQLLTKAIQFANGKKQHVFVLSIPDYGITPFGGNNPIISNEIDEYNTICKAITLGQGVSFTNITTISKMAATNQSLTANDGLHPSGKQYYLWAKLLAQEILKNY